MNVGIREYVYWGQQRHNVKYGFLNIIRGRNQLNPIRLMSMGSIYGHLKIVRMGFRSEIPISVRNESLVKASIHGYLDVVKLLLNHGAHLETDRNLPIRVAVNNGHYSLVKFYLRLKPDVVGNSVLIRLAAMGRYWNLVQLLVQSGADINGLNGEPLITAINDSNIDIVRWMIRYGVNVQIDENQPIRTVIEMGDIRMAQLIINRINIHTRNNEALRLASLNGHLEMVRLFLQYGASTDRSLILASRHGHPEIVQLLLDSGAQIQNEALLSAVENGHLEVTEILLNHGAEINQRVLTIAQLNRHWELVRLLFEHLSAQNVDPI